MKYAPQTEPSPLPFSPFKSCTVPRPIGWLSSVSTSGVENIAPYSQWQNLTFDPGMFRNGSGSADIPGREPASVKE